MEQRKRRKRQGKGKGGERKEKEKKQPFHSTDRRRITHQVIKSLLIQDIGMCVSVCVCSCMYMYAGMCMFMHKGACVVFFTASEISLKLITLDPRPGHYLCASQQKYSST